MAAIGESISDLLVDQPAAPPGGRGEVPMAFLILRDGKVIFDGDVHELAQSKDEYIREYIS